MIRHTETHDTLENRLSIAKKIAQELHPSFGVKLGYSIYTGGMVDAGQWHFERLLDVPLPDLLAFYEKTSELQKRPVDTSVKTVDGVFCQMSKRLGEMIFARLNNARESK